MAAETVLLDLDGTLSDSRPGIVACFRFMLSELGHDGEAVGDLTWAVGPPIGIAIRRLLGQFGDDRFDLALATYRARYTDTGIYECTRYQGVHEMLAELAAGGRRLFIATAKRRDYAERVVDYLGLRAHLPTVYGSLPAGGLDDKADLLAHIIAAERLDPATTVMVGDRSHDIHAAKANAVRSIGVLWGYGGETELREAGADGLAAVPADVLRAV